jgi:hypothetical protein
MGTVNADSAVAQLEDLIGGWRNYLNKRQAARYVGLSVRTLETRKDIPRFEYQPEANHGKGGKYCKVLFKRSELDRWIEKFRVRGAVQVAEGNKSRTLDDLARMAEEITRSLLG